MGVQTEAKFVLKGADGKPLATGNAEEIREAVTDRLADVLDFFVMLEQSTDEGELHLYLHSENADELTVGQLETLYEAGIIMDDYEENNHKAIMKKIGATVSHE